MQDEKDFNSKEFVYMLYINKYAYHRHSPLSGSGAELSLHVRDCRILLLCQPQSLLLHLSPHLPQFLLKLSNTTMQLDTLTRHLTYMETETYRKIHA